VRLAAAGAVVLEAAGRYRDAAGMSFDRPIWLLALLLLPAAVGLYLLAERRRMRYALRFTNMDVLAGVARGLAWRRYVAPAVFLLALATLCVALARPQAERMVTNEQATVILVLDASRSMQAEDVKPSRLLAAQTAARRFLEQVPDRLRVALIVFSGEVHVATPPTRDHTLVRESIDAIPPWGFSGTAIGDAIARAVEVGERAVDDGALLASFSAAPKPSGKARGLVTIVFLSDGRQNRGIIPPLEGAALAKTAGIPVHTVSLGTPNGVMRQGSGGGGFGGFGWRAVPDPATLREIARITGGRFYEARNAKSLTEAYEQLGSRVGRTPGRSEVTFAFLAAAAGLLIAAGLLSARWAPRLP
jgi:Ca-activated chloride channel homolog